MADSRHKKKTEKPGLQCPKVCLDYDEAAWSLGISKSKLYRLVSEGRLPCVVIDGNTVLRLDDLEKFAAKHTIVKGQT
jgi:excisionase family DNA binding protein